MRGNHVFSSFSNKISAPNLILILNQGDFSPFLSHLLKQKSMQAILMPSSLISMRCGLLVYFHTFSFTEKTETLSFYV